MSDAPIEPSPLPWFDQQWQLWQRQHKQDRLPNGILVAGSAGIGRFELAKRLCDYLLCSQTGSTGDICGTCKSCELNKAASHPDFLCVEPEEGTRGIKIDQVRQLNDFVLTTPQISPRRVAIIRPAEGMNSFAANAILKTLEEPPGAATIILLTQQLSLLLPTVRSRCQIIQLSLPDQAEAVQWLAARTQLSAEAATHLLQQAGGQPLTALAWSQTDKVQEKQQVLRQWTGYMEGAEDAFSVAGQWFKLDADWLLNWLGGWLHDLLVAELDGDAKLPPELKKVAPKWSGEQLWLLYKTLLEIRKSLAEQRNLNMQLVFEHWLLMNKKKVPDFKR